MMGAFLRRIRPTILVGWVILGGLAYAALAMSVNEVAAIAVTGIVATIKDLAAIEAAASDKPEDV